MRAHICWKCPLNSGFFLMSCLYFPAKSSRDVLKDSSCLPIWNVNRTRGGARMQLAFKQTHLCEFRENFGGYFFNNLDQSTIQWPIVVTCLTLRCHEGGLFHANSSYMYLDLMLILTNWANVIFAACQEEGASSFSCIFISLVFVSKRDLTSEFSITFPYATSPHSCLHLLYF